MVFRGVKIAIDKYELLQNLEETWLQPSPRLLLIRKLPPLSREEADAIRERFRATHRDPQALLCIDAGMSPGEYRLESFPSWQ